MVTLKINETRVCFGDISLSIMFIPLYTTLIFSEHTTNMCVLNMGTLRYFEHKNKIRFCMVMSFHEFLNSDNRA